MMKEKLKGIISSPFSFTAPKLPFVSVSMSTPPRNTSSSVLEHAANMPHSAATNTRAVITINIFFFITPPRGIWR